MVGKLFSLVIPGIFSTGGEGGAATTMMLSFIYIKDSQGEDSRGDDQTRWNKMERIIATPLKK